MGVQDKKTLPDLRQTKVKAVGLLTKLHKREWQDSIKGYVLLLPCFALLALVIGYPLIRSVELSFTELYLLKGLNSEYFVGLKQYVKLLHEPNLLIYLRNQLIWTSFTATVPVFVGLMFAIILNMQIKLRWLWRSIPLIPWATPIVVTALCWSWMLDKDWGILNYYLKNLGIISENIGFLTNIKTLWPSILLVSTWYWFPFNYVVILADIQGIPLELYDAAKVDGANSFACLRYITLPLLKPTLSILLILGTIWAINDFATIWTLTEGGPGLESTTIAPLIYLTTFKYFRLSYGAAIGVVLMLFSLLAIISYLRRVQGGEEE